MSELMDLLLEVKFYLSKDLKQGTEVAVLLGKIDNFIQSLISKLQPELSLISKKSLEEQSTTIEQLQTPKVELLDAFILDYSIEDGKFKIKQLLDLQKGDQAPSQQYMETDSNRYALLDLVTGKAKDHCALKEKTSSMTELHQLISNMPQSSPLIVLPNQQAQKSKYTYIMQTKECRSKLGKYYLVDRYYCLVTNGFADESVKQLFKQLKGITFGNKMLNSPDPSEVDEQIGNQIFDNTIPSLKAYLNSFTLSLNQIRPNIKAEATMSYSCCDSNKVKKIKLLTYAVYSCLSEHKLVVICNKENKHELSQLLLSIELALSPLKYVYPIILCTITRNHCQFLQSPVPLTIGMWGSEKRCENFMNQMFNCLSSQDPRNPGIPMSIIDLNTCTLVSPSPMKMQDCFIMEKLDQHLKKYGEGANFPLKHSNLIRKLLQVKKSKGKCSEWMAFLQEKVLQSQMHYVYAQA